MTFASEAGASGPTSAQIASFPTNAANGTPSAIAAGPDGQLWYTDQANNAIAIAHSSSSWTIPTSASNVLDITAGPDGNLWFAEAHGNNIGRITPSGTITEFPVPTMNAVPWYITTGPDGNLWFTEQTAQIGRITPGGTITEFPLPNPGDFGQGITAGPDGNLWFADRGANAIGRITPQGVVTEYPLPSGSSPRLISAGPDGNLWFTDRGANAIGRITPAGVITEFPVPTPNSLPYGITPGPDGNLWFTENTGNNVGRITPDGVITEVGIPTLASGPAGITAAPDGGLWFAENGASQIGRLGPDLNVSVASLAGATCFNFNGSHFAPDESSALSSAMAAPIGLTGSLITDGSGNLNVAGCAPGGLRRGTYPILASDVASGLTANSVWFPSGVIDGETTIGASCGTGCTYSAGPGTNMMVSGSNLVANQTITVRLQSSSDPGGCPSTTAGANTGDTGFFALELPLPVVSSGPCQGAYSLTASAGTVVGTGTFAPSSCPPPSASQQCPAPDVPVPTAPAPAAPPGPLVTRVAPAGGPSGGGGAVLISGIGFDGTASTATGHDSVTGVTFGGIPAQGFTVLGPDLILAVAPPGAGTVHVGVNTASTSGWAPPSEPSADAFTYPTHGSQMSLTCSPGAVTPGRASTCAATVSDPTGGGPAPSGAVSFSTAAQGVFSPASCTLASGSPSAAGCSVSFTPSVVGTATLRANYGGDSAHGASAAAFNLQVSTIALAAAPDHVWANGHQTTTLTLSYVPGRAVRLDASPATGTKLANSPQVQTADGAGQATWTVSSTNVATVRFTATDTQDGSVQATADVNFLRHKVVVQVLGINSSMSCGLFSSSCKFLPFIDKFSYIRSVLLTNYGFDSSDFLWYSYLGGTINQSTGGWVPRTYSCLESGQSYRDDLSYLQTLIKAFGQANPNTDIYLLGHSQGGLIALQELGYLGNLPSSVHVAGIITLDSPLGGVPEKNAWLASTSPTVCWQGPAVTELGAEYNTASDHSNQGSTASLLCTFFSCPDAYQSTTNTDAVVAFRNQVQVTTLGNRDDAVYFSPACSIDVPFFSVDNRSTMVVNGAAGGFARLGGNLPKPTPIHVLITTNPFTWPTSLSINYDDCVSNSHKQITIVDAPLVARTIGSQVTPSSPVASPSTATTPAPIGAALTSSALTVAVYIPPGTGGSATLTLQTTPSGQAAVAARSALGGLLTIGTARAHLQPGRVQTIHVRLNALGRKLARQRRLRAVRATIAVGGTRFTDTLTIHQRRSRSRHR